MQQAIFLDPFSQEPVEKRQKPVLPPISTLLQIHRPSQDTPRLSCSSSPPSSNDFSPVKRRTSLYTKPIHSPYERRIWSSFSHSSSTTQLFEDQVAQSLCDLKNGTRSCSEDSFDQLISESDQETGAIFKCSEEMCGKIFNRKFNLISHQKVHSGERPFVCTTCDTAFSRKHDLKRHIRSIHLQSKNHICPNCSAGFSRSDALKRHLDNEKKMNTFI